MDLKFKVLRITAAFLAVNILSQVVFPTVAFALTSGPSQPEIQSFEPVGTTEMVDLFTGDFTYNIPLFELPGPNGGYPFNLFYNSGISMDQEASWVGLGWNLNPGAIVRQMRGLPDEFNGLSTQNITREASMRPNVTIGVSGGTGGEFFGAANLSVGLGVYYNNYKGVGYNIDGGLNLSLKSYNDGDLVAGVGLGLGLSLDSQEGVGANASLSLTSQDESHRKTFDLGIGYNSRQGLSSISLEAQGANKIRSNSKHGTSLFKKGLAHMGGASTLSFFSGGYSPHVGLPMQGRNISLMFKLGVAEWGWFEHGYVSGHFNTQYLKNDGRKISAKAYGYLNLHNADNQSVTDFNREKDGMIRKTSPNLAIPVTTPDIYTLNGQGIGGMFRAYRNEAGTLFDQEVKSKYAGGSFGYEFGSGATDTHIGLDASVNYSSSETTQWDNDNDETEFNTASTNAGGLFEPSYFKVYGEHTVDPVNDLDYLLGKEPVRVTIEPSGVTSNAKNKIEKVESIVAGTNVGVQTTSVVYDNSTAASLKEREPRNMAVQYINNDQSKGMIALNPDGTRYVYELPATNDLQVECSFARGPVDDPWNPITSITAVSEDKPKYNYPFTDQYYSKTTIPSYAYSYLIKSILGADYIDADGDGVPSDGDYGYWVKFDYNDFDHDGTPDNNGIDYKWRAPFTGASFHQGLNTTPEDNRASYMYGKKKMFYLTSVETKTHKAIFHCSDRKDARGAYNEMQTGGTMGASMKKLDRVVLEAKNAPGKAIKTIYFSYSYDLCKNVENNDGQNDNTGSEGTIVNNKGKLTLKKVWFTYENNERGKLSPYSFNYNETLADENPLYNNVNYDRWGNYKDIGNDYCKGVNLPYTQQFDLSDSDFKSKVNKRMAAWSLKEITLPSGGTIQVDYEADDYAYVQDKRAMQMFEIYSLEEGAGRVDDIDYTRWNEGRHRRVYFKLQEPTANASDINEYVDGIDKLYFKVLMKLRADGDEPEDYISGYVDLEDKGMDPTSMIEGKYTRGYITLGRPRIGTKNGARSLPYHPFSAAAYQYIRTQRPQLAGIGDFDIDPNSSSAAVRDKAKSLASLIPTIRQIFTGFDEYCYKREWATKLILDKSVIRLNNPVKKKIGGGLRVKQIILKDNWSSSTISAEASSIYGQVYDYSIQEGDRTISSGVASYEPMIGGDENPFRYAKEYPEVIPLKTNNNLYFEYPINESYYPGPGVGYRRVTVKSLATHYKNIPDQPGSDGIDKDPFDIPSGIKNTGAQMHEFYTAKEFPIVTKETPIRLEPYTLFVPIPFVGQISINNMVGTQGYSISLNDMHGKLRKVSNYKLDKDGIVLYGTPVNSVEYFYNSTLVKRDDNPLHDYLVLNSALDVLKSKSDGSFGRMKMLIGQDYEFFTDMRMMKTKGESGGVRINSDILHLGFIFIPGFVPWPNIGYSLTDVRTAVTNKIIHQSGILVATEVFEEGSTVRTDNLVFDETGQPVLTRVTNSFDDPIYNYSIPAYQIYEGMGQAYKNIGYAFSGKLTYNSSRKLYLLSNSGVNESLLYPGDEFWVGAYKAIFAKKDAAGLWFAVESTTATIQDNFNLIRSGRRNNLIVKAGTLVTLGEKDTEKGNPLKRIIP